MTRRLRRSKIIGAPNADAADNLGRFSFCQPLWVVLESRYSSHSHGSERHRGRLSYKGQIPRGKCYEEVTRNRSQWNWALTQPPPTTSSWRYAAASLKGRITTAIQEATCNMQVATERVTTARKAATWEQLCVVSYLSI